MAVLEVVKHTKKIYKSLSNRQNNFWHKLSEIIIEIIIIVFAVSLSIWFHELSVHQYDKKIENKFLSGLHTDISGVVNEMRDDSAYLSLQYQYVTLANDMTNNASVTDDSLQHFMDMNAPLLYAMSLLQPNRGRYEGFKNSGHLRLLDDELMGDKIISFYEEGLLHLVYIERMYIDFKLDNFDAYNLRKDDNVSEKLYLKKYFLYTKESLKLIKEENNRLLVDAREIIHLLKTKDIHK